MRRSRLSKKTEMKSKQTIVLSFLGIALILFILFRYGIPLISDFTFFAGQLTKTGQNNKDKSPEKTFLSPPELDPLPKATKEQNIRITGTSLSGLKIILYLNGNEENETDVADDGSFEFPLSLSEGENIIKAKTKMGSKESDFSESLVIIYKQSGPELSLDSPGDGSEVNTSPVEVKGKTDPDSTVTVNDFQAIIDSNGNWSYFLGLKEGDNEVKIVSVDLAGNKTEKTVHFNYAP